MGKFGKIIDVVNRYENVTVRLLDVNNTNMKPVVIRRKGEMVDVMLPWNSKMSYEFERVEGVLDTWGIYDGDYEIISVKVGEGNYTIVNDNFVKRICEWIENKKKMLEQVEKLQKSIEIWFRTDEDGEASPSVR